MRTVLCVRPCERVHMHSLCVTLVPRERQPVELKVNGAQISKAPHNTTTIIIIITIIIMVAIITPVLI